MPGVIDLHSDAVEGVVEPRKNVHFAHDQALPQVDLLFAAAGVTTPFHAVCFGLEGRAGGDSLGLVRSLHRLGETGEGLGCVDHRVHVRFEVSEPEELPLVLELIADHTVDLVSVMDHSPGQGQFRTLESFIAYYVGNHGKSDAEAKALAERKLAKRDAAPAVVTALAEAIRSRDGERGTLAVHDLDDPGLVPGLAELGCTISEFPVNLDAARAAHSAGLATVFGAPNILRGRSQSGNIRAADAVEGGVCDALCSDYVPWTLIPAALKLRSDADMQLHDCVRMLTAHPARAAGLEDRGVIEVGRRADLVRVHDDPERPRVAEVWCRGRSALRNEPTFGRTP